MVEPGLLRHSEGLVATPGRHLEPGTEHSPLLLAVSAVGGWRDNPVRCRSISLELPGIDVPAESWSGRSRREARGLLPGSVVVGCIAAGGGGGGDLVGS